MNISSENELPDDIRQLKSIIMDLSRRLQNTHYILQSERQMKEQLFQQNEFYKFQLKQLLQSFSLEFARMRNFEWKTIQEQESLAYEQKKVQHTKNLETLRLLELDNQISGRKKFVPKNILKLRSSIVEMEKQQENQKKFLSFLSQYQQLNERLVNAIQQNQIQEVNDALQQGADVNYVDNIGYIPLHYAVIYGHFEICQLLLMKGADLSTYLTGFSSLVFACQYGHVSILSLLLSFGGNIVEKDRNGISPVMMALMNYHYHVMEFCIMNGADIFDYDLSTENTLLHTIVLISSSSYQNKYHATSEAVAGAGSVLRRPVTVPSLSLPPPSDQAPVNHLVIEQIIHFLVEQGSQPLLFKLNKQELTAFQLALQLQNRLCIDLLKPYYEADQNRTTLPPTSRVAIDTTQVTATPLSRSQSGPLKTKQSSALNPAMPRVSTKTGAGKLNKGVVAGKKTDNPPSEAEVELSQPDTMTLGSEPMTKAQLEKLSSHQSHDLGIPPPSPSPNLLDRINENFELDNHPPRMVGAIATERSNEGLEREIKPSMMQSTDLFSVASSVTFD